MNNVLSCLRIICIYTPLLYITVCNFWKQNLTTQPMKIRCKPCWALGLIPNKIFCIFSRFVYKLKTRSQEFHFQRAILSTLRIFSRDRISWMVFRPLLDFLSTDIQKTILKYRLAHIKLKIFNQKIYLRFLAYPIPI